MKKLIEKLKKLQKEIDFYTKEGKIKIEKKIELINEGIDLQDEFMSILQLVDDLVEDFIDEEPVERIGGTALGPINNASSNGNKSELSALEVCEEIVRKKMSVNQIVRNFKKDEVLNCAISLELSADRKMREQRIARLVYEELLPRYSENLEAQVKKKNKKFLGIF